MAKKTADAYQPGDLGTCEGGLGTGVVAGAVVNYQDVSIWQVLMDLIYRAANDILLVECRNDDDDASRLWLRGLGHVLHDLQLAATASGAPFGSTPPPHTASASLPRAG